MIFILLFQFLGTHEPELGAFLLTLIIEAVLLWIASRGARRAADRKWKWDVIHNGAILRQDVRESYEKRIVELETRNKYLEARHDVVVPAINSTAHAMATIAEHFSKEAQAEKP